MGESKRDTVYYVFGQVQKLHYQRLYNLLDEIGLYPGQPHLLYVLDLRGGLSQKELSEILHVAPATMTATIKKMESLELIYRERDPHDKRISRVYISSKGRNMARESMKVFERINEDCFGNFTEEEKKNLQLLLEKIRRNLEEVSF